MITKPKQFLLEQELERERFLKRLGEKESVQLLESLLTSGLVEEFTFSDHQPMALAMSIKYARKQYLFRDGPKIYWMWSR